jgi:hypothetical protein
MGISADFVRDLRGGIRRPPEAVSPPLENLEHDPGSERARKQMNPQAMAAEDALAFAMTVGIEWPLLAWFSKLGFRRTGLFCLLMNGVTWFAAAAILQIRTVPIPTLEGAIIAVEAVLMGLYWQWPAGKAITASLLLNLTSWLVGEKLFLGVLHFLGGRS